MHAAGRGPRYAFPGRQAGSLLMPAVWLRGLPSIAVVLNHRQHQSHGRLPAACCPTMRPRVSAATISKGEPGHRRLIALHLDPSTLAGALLVQHKTGSVVSMLLLPCAFGRERNAASRTACHPIIPKQFFSSTLILVSGPLSEPVTHSS